MSWAADVAKNGYLALQDFDEKVGSYVNLDDHRLLTQCSRYENDPREPIRGPQEVLKTKGPLTGGIIWDPEEFGKNPPFWSFVFPSEAEPSKEVCVGGEDLTPKNTTVERRGGGGNSTTTTNGAQGGTTSVSPQTHTNGAKFKAIKGSDWKDLDPNRLTLEAATPEGYYPVGGWPGIMLRGTDQSAQHNLFCPAGGALIAPHFGGTTQVGTPVFDVDAGKVNQQRRARIQSLIRTYQYPAELTDGKDPSGVAIQLSRAHCAIGGQGIVADASTGPISSGTTQGRERDTTQAGGVFRPPGTGEGQITEPGAATIPRNTTTTPRNPETTTDPTPTTTTVAAGQVLAALSVHNGGFIDVGDENDQHLLWTTPGDGEKINSAHISTLAYFRGGVGDGPIEFSAEPWIMPNKGPVRLKTEIQFDGADKHPHPRGEKKGKWKLITYGNLAVVPRDPEFPPPGIPPEGPPPTQTPPQTPPPRDPNDGPEDPTLTNPDPFITGDAPYDLFVVGAMQEIAVPATVGRPQLYFSKAVDTRNLGANPTNATVAKATKAWVQSPVVIREEYVGQQKGPNFVRTTRDRSRYSGFGTAYGGKVYYPPEWGAESNTADPSSRPSSVARVWYWKDQVRLAFGQPDFTSDSVGTINGYEIYKDSSHVLTFIETDSDASTLSTQTLQKGVSGQIALTSDLVAGFGDGSDGDVTLSSNTTLTRDMFYNSLNVAGYTLYTAGHRIYVRGALSGTGTISNTGGAASGTVAGDGADNSSDSAALGGGTNGGGPATNGEARTYYRSHTSTSAGIGGDGGGAGAGSGGIDSSSNTTFPLTPAYAQAIAGQFTNGFWGGGTGGGGGESNGGTNVGGAGGGGGGVIMIFAYTYSFTGTIDVSGGNGGAGVGSDGGSVGGGGGGGGGGGAIILHSTTLESSRGGTFTVSGGVGGPGGESAGGNGTAGSNGADGVAIHL